MRFNKIIHKKVIQSFQPIFLWCLAISYLSILVNYHSNAQSKKVKPNVVIILTDDQGWGDFSYNKNTILKTLNIDKLASQGASFSNFYVSPLCAPTRASLLTGRYHLRTGTVSVSKGLEVMNESENTLAELFVANGYKTGGFGKWHNGSHYPNDPNGQGFQEFFGFCGGHWSNYFNTTYQHNQSFEKKEGYIADVLTKKAIDFISQNKNQPFLCYLALNTPHSPHQVPDKYFDKYKQKGVSDELAAIYGMCENIDDNVKRVTDAINKLKVDMNTIVIFLTDNGPNGERYNGNLRDIKGSLYEGGVKAPLFISWKDKIKAGLVIDNLSQHIDLYPTLVDLCSLKNNSKLKLDGISRSSMLFGKLVKENRNIYSHVAQPVLNEKLNPYSGSLRNQTNSLVLKNEKVELYDLVNDPSQKQNIAENFSEKTEELKAEYFNWFNDCVTNYDFNRPIPLESKTIILPTYESTFSSGLKFKEGHGWVHDWLINFGAETDIIVWNTKSKKSQTYSVVLEYAVSDISENITAEIKVNNLKGITKIISKKCDPPYFNSPDRIPRKEVYERGWCQLELGKITIPKGLNRVILSTTKTGNKSNAEINSIKLILDN